MTVLGTEVFAVEWGRPRDERRGFEGTSADTEIPYGFSAQTVGALPLEPEEP